MGLQRLRLLGRKSPFLAGGKDPGTRTIMQGFHTHLEAAAGAIRYRSSRILRRDSRAVRSSGDTVPSATFRTRAASA